MINGIISSGYAQTVRFTQPNISQLPQGSSSPFEYKTGTDTVSISDEAKFPLLSSLFPSAGSNSISIRDIEESLSNATSSVEKRLQSLYSKHGISSNSKMEISVGYDGSILINGESPASETLAEEINADDEFGRSLIRELKDSLDVYAYTFSENSFANIPTIRGKNVKLEKPTLSCYVITPWKEGVLESNLLGRFNLSNLLAVLTVLGIMQVDLHDALAKISELKPVDGRMQVFGGKNKKPLVVVDYAHSPDALEQALLTLREYCQGSLWCVFGCGGDRDRSKRSLMGEVAERLSNHVVITNDNPRTEDPKQIVNDILKGLSNSEVVKVEYDRQVAIEYAINSAEVNDIVLIAGKGHEDYQIIGTERRHFSDQEVVVGVLNTSGSRGL